MIVYGMKLEETETRNFPCVGFIYRLRELSALSGVQKKTGLT